MSDVTIEFEDDTDASLNDTITLQVVDYTDDIDPGVKRYPLGILKVFQQFFKGLVGDYVFPPVLLTDFGAVLETYNLTAIIDEGNVADTEDKVRELKVYFRKNGRIADRTYLKIGDYVTDNSLNLLYRAGKGTEGKIGKATFKWVGKQYRYVVLTFEFLPGIELELF